MQFLFERTKVRDQRTHHSCQSIKTEYGYVEDYKIVDLRLFLWWSMTTCSHFLCPVLCWLSAPLDIHQLILCSLLCNSSHYFLNDFSTYFILMGVVTLFSMYYEGNIFMVAREKDVAGVVSTLISHFCSLK